LITSLPNLNGLKQEYHTTKRSWSADDDCEQQVLAVALRLQLTTPSAK